MKIIEFSREAARKAFVLWKSGHELPALNSDYSTIRTELTELFRNAKENVSEDRTEYMTDVLFGLKLYEYLDKKPWFNLRLAANDGFWRHIAVAVIPNVVAERWGEGKENYLWKQSNSLWPKTAWWFIHLSWHNSLDETKAVLTQKHFNSDTIQGIVERTGKKGTYVEVYREIIYQYSQLDYTTVLKFKKQMTQGSDSLFRAVMRLNTARSLVTDPCLTQDGLSGYVKSMIKELTSTL